jgi:hypothetical protein
MPIILTIQKPNVRHFSVRGFAAVLKPDPFDGKNFLIWKAKMELWLTAMSCFHAAEGKPINLPPEDKAKFKAEDNLFRGAVISALDTKFQKSYIFLPTCKELWDALVGKFGVTAAGSVGVSRRGVPGPTSEMSPRAPAQMGRRETEREGGKKGSRSEREVEIPRPSCLSHAQVGCACSRGLQASTREGSERPHASACPVLFPARPTLCKRALVLPFIGVRRGSRCTMGGVAEC